MAASPRHERRDERLGEVTRLLGNRHCKGMPCLELPEA